MKLGPLPKLEKWNTMTLKNFDNDVMLGNYDVIFNFEIYGRFGAIQKLDSRCMVHDFQFSINNDLLSNERWKQNYKTFNTALILLLWKKVLVLPKKCWLFEKKMLTPAKYRLSWHYEVCSDVPNFKLLV